MRIGVLSGIILAFDVACSAEEALQFREGKKEKEIR